MLSAKPVETAPPQAMEAPSVSSHPDFYPFEIVPGLSNFRDIGGWYIVAPAQAKFRFRNVRPGILFRGSDTNRITLEGEEKLRQLGIKTDFDLRSKQQIEKTGGYKEIPGIERRWTPVFAEEQYTEDAARKRYELYAAEGTEGIVAAFVEILTAGAPMFRAVLSHLLNPASTSGYPPAIFMHCTTGNNRTGVFISLLLLLLGVPSEIVVEEYTLSEKGLAPTRHVNVERLLKKGAFEEYGPEEARRKCERMVGARRESMEALIVEVGRRWGGAKGYFVGEVGLSEVEIGRLRDIFTEEEEYGIRQVSDGQSDSGSLSDEVVERIGEVTKAEREVAMVEAKT